MNWGLVITIIGSLVFGGFVGFINSRISKKAILRTELSMAIGVNAIRFLIDILALAVVFAFCRITAVSMLVPLLACAVGLTVGGMFFLVRLSREANAETKAVVSENRAAQNTQQREDEG